MNQPSPFTAASRRRRCFPLRRARPLLIPAALLLALLVAGCGSSKPAAPTSVAAAAPAQTAPTAPTTQTTQTNAGAQQASRVAPAHRRARQTAARRAAQARAAKLQAQRAARLRAARAAAARKRAAQASAAKPTKTTPAVHTTPTPAGTIVSVKRTGLGSVLVDAQGRTLYLFEKDTAGQSACSAACAGVWPPVTTTGKPAAGNGAIQSALGTTPRPGGVLQVTYGGHPLYLFVGDAHAGQTTGEGLNQFGALWWAVSPAGLKVMK